jgi:hypothetical protein
MNNETEIVLDLEELKKQEGTLNEGLLRMFGGVIEMILKSMFGHTAAANLFGSQAVVKGKPADLKALARALGSESKYLQSVKEHGLDNERTYKSKSSLTKAVKGFEKTTGLKWPFK